jgi:hypothetical protein
MSNKLKELRYGLIIVLAAIGAYLFRMRGGSLGPSLPRPFEQAIFCLIFAPIVYLSLDGALQSYWLYGTAFTAYALAVVAVLKGHGRNMDLGHYHKPNSETEPEWYEWTIKWLVGKVPEYWYDVVGIGVSGFTYTVIPGLVVAFAPLSGYSLWAIPLGIGLALSGFTKSLAYMIGWHIQDRAMERGLIVSKVHEGNPHRGIKGLPYHIDHATGIGEALTGFFIWLIFGAALVTFFWQELLGLVGL